MVHGIFVTVRGREREVSSLIRSVVKHVSEFEDKLLLLEEVICFGKDSSPRLLGIR